MNWFFILMLVLITGKAILASRITISDNAYSNIVIAIGPSTPRSQSDAIIKNIKVQIYRRDVYFSKNSLSFISLNTSLYTFILFFFYKILFTIILKIYSFIISPKASSKEQFRTRHIFFAVDKNKSFDLPIHS